MQKQELNSQSLCFRATVLTPELQCPLWPALLALLNLWNPFLSWGKPLFPTDIAKLGYSADTVCFLLCSTNECFHEHPLDKQ